MCSTASSASHAHLLCRVILEEALRRDEEPDITFLLVPKTRARILKPLQDFKDPSKPIAVHATSRLMVIDEQLCLPSPSLRSVKTSVTRSSCKEKWARAKAVFSEWLEIIVDCHRPVPEHVRHCDTFSEASSGGGSITASLWKFSDKIATRFL